MNSADLKRQILMESDNLGVRKRIQSGETGLNSDDYLAMGAAFEQMTKTVGWAHVEAYILKNSNPLGLLFAEKDDPIQKGKARGLVELMQYVDQIIKARNALLEEMDG